MARHERRTGIAKGNAVRAIAAGGNRKEAAIAAGVTSSTIDRWIRNDADFADKCDRAERSLRDEVVDKLQQRKTRLLELLDEFLRTGVSKVVVKESRVGDLDSVETITTRSLPDQWMYQWLVGIEPAEVQAEPFEVRVTISDPDPDPDQAEYEALMEAELGEAKRAIADAADADEVGE